MKNIKRRILSFAMAFGLIIGVSSVPAHAEWKQSGVNWQYTNSDGTLKTGWLQDGSNWYYFSPKGQMVTGWITDNNTWYYMREDGSLNNAKTTATMPADIQAVYNEVQPFANGLAIKYAGITFIKNASSFSNQVANNTWLIGFSTYDSHGNKSDYLFYDPQNAQVFKLQEDFSVQYVGQSIKSDAITEEKAIEISKEYAASNNINISNMSTSDSEDNNVYKIDYSALGNNNQTSIAEQFIVDKTTGIVFDEYQMNK